MELAGALHVTRRFLLGKAAANPLEAAVFATLNRMSRDILSCTVAAFDAAPPGQRNRLFAPSFLLDPDQPLDKATLSTALAKEIAQRAGVLVFGDPQGPEQDRPGRIRVYKPSNLHRTRPPGRHCGEREQDDTTAQASAGVSRNTRIRQQLAG
jgi:hypothetical protein